MPRVLVTIHREAPRDQFMKALDEAGVTYKPYPHIPRLFFVDGFGVDDFPLRGHPFVKDVEDADEQKFHGAVSQEITIDVGQVNGSWPLLRHIHRDPPWENKGLRLPITLTYECHRTGKGVDYYSIDTGIQTDHPEWGGRPVTHVYVSTPNPDGDDNGHGTGTASTSCGVTVGFARDANLFSCKCLGANNTGSPFEIANAVNAALGHYLSRAAYDTPAVVNMSLSGSGGAYVAAVEAAIDNGMVVVAAAGDDMVWQRENNVLPAEVAGVVNVGGTMMGDLPYNTGSSGSNYGLEVDILAGSQYCWAATWTGAVASGYRRWDGTSFGCGYASGAIACMLEGYHRLTGREQVEQVRKYVYDQATFGRYRNDPRQWPMTPAILYLDPSDNPPPIPGLTKRPVGTQDLRVTAAGIDILKPLSASGNLRVSAAGLDVLRTI